MDIPSLVLYTHKYCSVVRAETCVHKSQGTPLKTFTPILLAFRALLLYLQTCDNLGTRSTAT